MASRSSRGREEAGLRVEVEETLVLGLVVRELKWVHAAGVAEEGFQEGFEVGDEAAGVAEEGLQKKLHGVGDGRHRRGWKESCGGGGVCCFLRSKKEGGGKWLRERWWEFVLFCAARRRNIAL
jgi:hypothetical protein